MMVAVCGFAVDTSMTFTTSKTTGIFIFCAYFSMKHKNYH